MKAIIFVSAKAALLEGLDNQGEDTIEFNPADLTEEQRAALAKCSDLKDGMFVLPKAHPVSKPDIDALRQILDFEISVTKEQQAKDLQRTEMAIAKFKEWAKGQPEKTVTKHYDTWGVELPYIGYADTVKEVLGLQNNPRRSDEGLLLDYLVKDNADIKDAYEDAKSLAFWLNLEDNIDQMIRDKKIRTNAEEYKREQEALKAEAIAKEQRKVNQIKAWVEANGTENQKLRYKDGFLPDQEIIDAIRAEVYAPLDVFNRYKKLTKSDVCEGEDEYDRHDVSFDVEDAEHLSADQYDALLKIKEAIPTATIEPRIHTAKCDDCETEVTRIGFMVRLTVGDFEFSREYGM